MGITHESARGLSRQCPNGAFISKLENGMYTGDVLHDCIASPVGYWSISDASIQLATTTTIQRRARVMENLTQCPGSLNHYTQNTEWFVLE